jgi:hypothetical protein
VDAVVLVEAVLVLLVVLLDPDRAHDALRLVLLVHHVVVDDVLLNLLAVVAHRGAAGPQVGEELRAVVVELVRQLVGDLVVDEALGTCFLSSFWKSLMINTRSIRFWIALSCRASSFWLNSCSLRGLALELGDEGRDLAADVVDRDDLVLGDRRDPVGEAQVKVVVRRGGLRLAPDETSRVATSAA